MVVPCWQIQVHGTQMYNFTQKLKMVMNQLKIWSKKLFGNTQEKLSQNANEINMIEEKLLQQPNNPRLNAWMR